ncbi:MAG: glutamine-hydrolyzing carbamoyl-phosphate synthase small subunit [Lentisphaerae bacterium]|nr:glutamine-hydrolyzing carbamoyl-phosphate synthase small subunit [Lentisphaerota bacterium]
MAAFNWAEQRHKRAYLALEDGTILRGWSVGAPVDRVGEVVFNTGLTGYQEIISDPSYAGQFVTFTCPEIGNVGLNAADRESLRIHASGLVMQACNAASNWRSESELGRALEDAGVPALAGIDTRRLTRLLRDQGTMKGFMCVTGTVGEADGVAQARAWEGLDGQDYAARVSCAEPYAWDADGRETCSWGMAASLPPADLKIVAYDFGIKWNILRGLRRQGMQVTVVPAKTPAARVLELKPDGVLLSNGPADPAALPYAVAAIRELLGQVPVMGICLGHQLLGLALGGRTYRLKFGHHGCNHPVMDLATGSVAITSQNHNFAVAAETLDAARVDVTHINLNDQTVEGIRCKDFPAFSVQYHPEACPGPHDAAPLFNQFRRLITVSGRAAH